MPSYRTDWSVFLTMHARREVEVAALAVAAGATVGWARRTRRELHRLRAGAVEARALAARLTWLADHDALTGLVNRSVLHARLDDALAEAWPGSVALLFIDLDGFKQVNDRHGHAMGDEVLRAAAERLDRCVQPPGLLARVGGDEFVVLLTGADVDRCPAGAADAIRAELLDPFPVGPRDVACITASIGVAVAHRARITGAELLRAADAAMYAAKAGGRNQVSHAGPLS